MFLATRLHTARAPRHETPPIDCCRWCKSSPFVDLYAHALPLRHWPVLRVKLVDLFLLFRYWATQLRFSRPEHLLCRRTDRGPVSILLKIGFGYSLRKHQAMGALCTTPSLPTSCRKYGSIFTLLLQFDQSSSALECIRPHRYAGSAVPRHLCRSSAGLLPTLICLFSRSPLSSYKSTTLKSSGLCSRT